MIPEDDGDFSATKDDTSRISNSTTSWSSSRLKDPRIVRVSRAFGGKDRHSKVCTVRGVRDRRIRLSVPTAIQLYDLQDRLGLNRPSKVVDWLLEEAKHAIGELPPLQIPQGMSPIGSKILHHRPMFLDESHQQHRGFLFPQSDIKGKDVLGETSSHRHEVYGRRGHQEERSQLQSEFSPSAVSNFLPRQTVSSCPSPLNGSLPGNNPFFRWDHPHRIHESSTSQANNEDLRHHHSNFSALVQLPSFPPLDSHPVLVYRHQMSQFSGKNPPEFEPKEDVELHNLQLSNSSLGFINMTANLLPRQNSAAGEQIKNNQFRSS